MFCQLETLRHCLPPSVRRTLDELPESLDETYERVLNEIKKPNRDHARRLLQCLVVAIRPLEVEELAEVLAIDFDDAEGIPKLNPNWRWQDEEQAILTSCSSLIAIVETGRSRVVQFSHFSVKEFLTSTRLADSRKDVSRYHIDLEPAHTVLAQACMGVLLQPDDRLEDNSIGRSFSHAGYAARYWVTHAQFKSVSSSLKKAMEDLFDLDKPHFATWLDLHNMGRMPGQKRIHSLFLSLATFSPSNASPLYYAALCGFQDLVEHLVIKHPQHVNACGGSRGTPLAAALVERHFQTANILHDNGANLDVHYRNGYTPLQSAAWYGDHEMVQVLLGYVDVNARGDDGWTALHEAALDGSDNWKLPNIVQSSLDVTRTLLQHGADVNARTDFGLTTLHATTDVEVVRVLLKHGANVSAEDEEGRTPLHEAAKNGNVELVRMLIEHGADVNVRTKDGSTPLLMAAKLGNMEDEEGETQLHKETRNGNVELVRMLIEHGADVNVRTNYSSTPLLAAARFGNIEVVRVLLEHGANVEAEDKKRRTSFQIASMKGYNDVVELLSDHGAKRVFSVSTSSLCLPW